jgi:DNA-binding NtrC family response regulator
MPGGLDGIETMMEIRKLQKDASVIVITAYATVDTAITAMKEGAQEYVVKPCHPQEISLLVERIIRVKNLERENAILRRKLTRQYRFHDLVSKNPRMAEIFDLVREVASQRSTVLVQGESGTGKELVARAIHFSGDRGGGPFVAVSCAALAETLLESELFGHEKGSFTGAVAQRKGKFELADGGTLFLDEIGDISPKLQVDLLRVLQERRFFRVGGNTEIAVDARVIAATHRDLAADVREGRFRDDLYYRLNVINIRIPPLRERIEDVPLLAQEFLDRLAHELGREVSGISEEALRLLMDHDWPGNVRELENAVERALVTCKSGILGALDFAFLSRPAGAPGSGLSLPPGLTLQEMEKQYVAATLARLQGNVKAAAEALGIDRSTLYEKIKRYEIPR